MTFSIVKINKKKTSDHAPVEIDGHGGHDGPVGHHSEHSHAESHKRGPLPFIASPVDPEALKWLAKRKRSSSGVARSTTVAAFESESTESALAQRIFRKQHEASSLELFFDLFFVANLAVFTTLSAHVDWPSLSNYIGFFAILWTTWFHVSMYDVRFYTDSIFTRICKFGHMGVMVALVGLSSMYSAVLKGDAGISRAFHGIAILMFVSRILHLFQYGVVLYFVRVFDKTMVPMLLTMFVYLAAGFCFLATYLMDGADLTLTGTQGKQHVRYWYIIICIEAVLVISIASIWRILSFKHTHLVERVGLLSLIIMGEGIIGLVKSTAYAVQGAKQPAYQESAITACAVLIIYLIYILYFDNIDHHRFGTIKQQIWTLFHFPAHLAILLTVEGSTALLLWNTCRNAIIHIQKTLPSAANPKGSYPDFDKWYAGIAGVYDSISNEYHYKDLSDYYNQTAFDTDLAKLSKAKTNFGSGNWTADVAPTLKKMNGYVQYFIYQNFGAEGPLNDIKKAKDYNVKVGYYESGFRFVTIYYYISAGALLLAFAFLYAFGRQRATRVEWMSFGIRVFGGICLPIATVSQFMEKAGDQVSFRFRYPYLIIPIVTLGFFLVIIVDNIAKAIAEKHFTLVESRKLKRMTSYDPKGPAVTEEERDLTDEESSYEMHRQKEAHHGSPHVVQGPPGTSDHDSLIQNVQRTPTITFDEAGRRTEGYPLPAQQEIQPHYKDEEAGSYNRRY